MSDRENPDLTIALLERQVSEYDALLRVAEERLRRAEKFVNRLARELKAWGNVPTGIGETVLALIGVTASQGRPDWGAKEHARKLWERLEEQDA